MNSSPTLEAKAWWGQNVNTHPVWRVEELPDAQFKYLLLPLKLVYEIRKDLLILGKPDTELPVLIHSYFWEVVSSVLSEYEPYLITGIAAMQLLLGEQSIPHHVNILTAQSSNKIQLQGISTLAIEKNPDLFSIPNKEIFSTTIYTSRNYCLSIESPESLLIRLRPRHFLDFPQLISGFLKAIDFNLEFLSELILRSSKPVTYLRLAELFKQVGKIREAELFKNYIKVTTQYAAPGKSQILKYSLPKTLAQPKRISDSTYVVRFRDQLKTYSAHIEDKIKNLPIPHWNLVKIKNYIEKTKQYDTYHSSTIEGYRVTQEEIQKLIEGREILTLGNNTEDIERKIALKGYLLAHQFVMNLTEKFFNANNPFTESIIKEIYANLFFPTVEAGLLSKNQLTQYRNDAVYIRNSRAVPPNHLKINELMTCLVDEINEIPNPVTQAILAHYGFVTIHPYFDGNGRVARFLMNYLLCHRGIPWITIRVEDREHYFSALESAQCDENIGPFCDFMVGYFSFSLNPVA